jgi:hypothetical protein
MFLKVIIDWWLIFFINTWKNLQIIFNSKKIIDYDSINLIKVLWETYLSNIKLIECKIVKIKDLLDLIFLNILVFILKTLY